MVHNHVNITSSLTGQYYLLKPLAQLPSDLNVNAPSQPILGSYPKRAFGATFRSFIPAWYHSRPWLEYSVRRDACFCFPCRKYGSSANERDVVFTLTGFNNWKAALERDKGLKRHVSSYNHVHSSTTWTQHKSRDWLREDGCDWMREDGCDWLREDGNDEL